MKNLLLSLLSLLFLGLAVVATLGGWSANQYLNSGPLEETKYVLIERGRGVSAIAKKLESENIISNKIIFKVAARFSDSLKAGEYEFPAKISMVEVVKKMAEGKVFGRKITIPEGLTSYQIVKILNKTNDLSGGIGAIPKEGSLLPDTYIFSKDEARLKKIEQMQLAMIKVVDDLWDNRAKNLPIKTKAEAIILASIVEKETGVAAERKRIAGVFINRLNKNIALQTDPTVIYALTMGKIRDNGKGPLGRRLLRKDLAVNSPYNTYKNTGLPPGAICNPGRAAIEATLNPEVHNYIFFVADGTGGHAFAKTLSEHNANVTKWRRIRRKNK